VIVFLDGKRGVWGKSVDVSVVQPCAIPVGGVFILWLFFFFFFFFYFMEKKKRRGNASEIPQPSLSFYLLNDTEIGPSKGGLVGGFRGRSREGAGGIEGSGRGSSLSLSLSLPSFLSEAVPLRHPWGPPCGLFFKRSSKGPSPLFLCFHWLGERGCSPALVIRFDLSTWLCYGNC
jgi:hypothetical protein